MDNDDLRCVYYILLFLLMICMLICRAGTDLVDLYKLPAVQAYLNGLPSKELHSDKSLYQHGTLRKVC